jgi:hypothetical protein
LLWWFRDKDDLLESGIHALGLRQYYVNRTKKQSMTS